MKLVTVNSKASCFGDLVELYYNESSTSSMDRHYAPEGIKITWYGNTPKTLKDSNCGANAVQNLGGRFMNPICEMKGYNAILHQLTVMGY